MEQLDDSDLIRGKANLDFVNAWRVSEELTVVDPDGDQRETLAGVRKYAKDRIDEDLTQIDEAVVSANESATSASDSADTAEGIANRWSSTALGLLNTAEGRYFSTPSPVPEEVAIIWQKVAGIAVDTLKRTLSSEAVSALRAAVVVTPTEPVPYRSWRPGPRLINSREDAEGKVLNAETDTGSFLVDVIEWMTSAGGHRTAGEWLWVFHDLADKALYGLRPNGELFFKPSKEVCDFFAALFGLVGADGSGNAVLRGIRWTGDDLPFRSSGGGLIAIGDDADHDFFIIRLNGETYCKPDALMLAHISAALGAYPASAWRGSSAARDVRSSQSVIRAIVDDTTAQPYWTGEVVQPRLGTTTPTALACATGQLVGVHTVGQSGAVASGTAVSPFTTPRFPMHCVRYSVQSSPASVGADGLSVVDLATLTNIVPTSDPAGAAPILANYIAYSVAQRARAASRQAPAILARYDARGSIPLSDLLKGGNLYANLMTSIKAADLTAKAHGLDYRPWIIIAHGENSPNQATAANVTAYRTPFAGLLDNYQADVLEAVGKYPTIFVLQTNGDSTGNNPLGTGPIAQLQETRARRGSRVVMVGPMYHAPLSDILHGNELARMMFGELIAVAAHEIERTGSFLNMDVVSVTRVGAVLTVKFTRPWKGDGDWVPATIKQGFSWADDSGVAAPTVSTVSLPDGSDTATVTLSAVPTAANKTLSYAMAPGPLVNGNVYPVPNWAASRGQIYAESGYTSDWAQAGQPIPPTVRLYLQRFQEPVA